MLLSIGIFVNKRNVMVVLKTILILLLVYFAAKVMIKYFGPLLLKYVFKKVQKNMEKQFNQKQQAPEQKPPKASRSKSSKVGEYIDYEEID